MKLIDSRICVVLAAVLLFFVVSPSLHAADFKIKPLIVSGDSASGGDTFLFVGPAQLNSRGDMVFPARTLTRTGLYVAAEAAVSFVLQEGDNFVSGRLPEPSTLGLTLRNGPFDPKRFDNYGFADNRVIICSKIAFIILGNIFIDGARNVVVQGGREVNLVSGNSIISLACPTFEFVGRTTYGENASITGAALTGVTNAGTIALLLGVQISGQIRTPILLFKGGTIEIVDLIGTSNPEGTGTIQLVGAGTINDNETLLLPYSTSKSAFFAQGLILVSGNAITPVAFAGASAPRGRTFRLFSPINFTDRLALNSAAQVVFAASLDDGSEGLFRREPDGNFTILAQDRTTGYLNNTSSLSINEKGEVAALIFRSFPKLVQEIILFGSNGDVSKVVAQNDVLRDGAKFLLVGQPRVNNKGEIVFFGFLSNGESGIFKASRGLETEFVDPVPDLLAGDTVTSDATELAKMGRVVTGIAADGAARVVVRVKTGQTGNVEFSLVDEGGAALPPSNFNGSLSQVSEELGSDSVSVPAADVEGFGPMAFAAYHAPVDFATGPNSKEAGDPDRKVFIKVKLTTSTGETVESTESLKIVRPPVVLVHGIWSDRTTWNQFGPFNPLLPDPRFAIFRVDYPGSDGFVPNADIALGLFRNFMDRFRDGQNPVRIPVTAIQTDIVAHSMGGDVIRTMVIRPGFLNNDNFGKGNVRKLITIDTPHLGSHLANRLLRSNLFCRVAFGLSGHPVGGAVRDIAVDSPTLRTLQETRLFGLSTHVIVGIASSAQERSAEDNFGNLAFGLVPLVCPRLLPGGSFQEVFGGPSDLLVSDESQAAFGLGFLGGSPPATVSNGIIHSVIPKLFTLGPDSLSRNIVDGQIVEVPAANPQRVIELLNRSILGGDFAPIRP